MVKIFGFEIARGKAKASDANPLGISGPGVQAALQQTKPSKPLASSFPRAEMGDSGTRLIHGIITEEYNPQLQGVEGIKKFDEMRKSDATVRAAMAAVTLPIRRAEWFVNSATDGETPEAKQAQEVANFVEHALFDWLEDMTFDDVVRQALLMVPFGVMLFEKIYTTKDHDGKTYVTLKKLAPRLPKSILMWELSDQTFGIQQIRQDGVLAQIPGSKLLIFVNEREGDNWWGTSMLRSAYKHWYYKDNFYKIDAVAFERQGLGVPVMKMPVGYTEADEQKVVTALQNLRANENSYMAIPNTYEFEFANMGARTTRDPETSINHHNKEILLSVLAQFLELGQTKSNSGSRALSQDHSDLFLKAIESIANTFISEINKNLIPELVDMNFSDVKVYPVLDYSGISKVDMASLGMAYSQLVTAGAITPTDDDQQYIRAAMGLPPRSQEDIEAAAEEERSMESQLDHANIESDGEPAPKGPVEDAAGAAAKKPQTKQQKKKTDVATKAKPPKKPNARAKASDHTGRPAARTFDDGEGFMSWRPLTFAEKKVSYQNIQDAMDSMEKNLTDASLELLQKAKDAFMARLHAAIESGDQKAIAALELGFVNDYKALIKDAAKKAYEYGKNNVSTEIGVQVPPNNAESLATIDMMADTIANKTAADIETKAKLAAGNAIKQGTSVLQAVGSIDSLIDDTIDDAIRHTTGILISQNINGGRNDVLARNKDSITALQRSEVLDERTCEFCLSMDGLTVTPDDDWAATDIFHENCRGIWVAILNDEQGAEDIEITGVPDKIGDYYGGTPNDLVQPPRAIVRPDSPAAAFVKERDAAKKK